MKVTKHRALVMMGATQLQHDFDAMPSNEDVLRQFGLLGLPMKREPVITITQVVVEVKETMGQVLEAWLAREGLVVAKPTEGDEGVVHVRLTTVAKAFDAFVRERGVQ